MEDLIGDWQAKEDINFSNGATLPKGAIVAVFEIDRILNKVHFELGPNYGGWFSVNMLNDFEQVL